MSLLNSWTGLDLKIQAVRVLCVLTRAALTALLRKSLAGYTRNRIHSQSTRHTSICTIPAALAALATASVFPGSVTQLVHVHMCKTCARSCFRDLSYRMGGGGYYFLLLAIPPFRDN